MQDQALQESVRDMAALMGECINAAVADVTVETEAETVREAFAACQGCVEMLAMAATGAGARGLNVICQILQENLEQLVTSEVAHWQPHQEQIIALLKEWSILTQDYITAFANPELHTALLTFFTNSCWPRPITEQQIEDFLASIQPDADVTSSPSPPPSADSTDLSLTLDPGLNPKLIAAFFQEAPLNVADFTAALSHIFKGENLKPNLALAQRLAHNLKGSANILGIKGLANLTHLIEDILEYLTEQQQQPPPDLGQVLQEAADCLEDMLDAVRNNAPAPQTTANVVQELLNWTWRIKNGQFNVALPSNEHNQQSLETTITPEAIENELAITKVLRIPTATIDKLFKLVSELSIAIDQIHDQHQLLRQRVNELHAQDDSIQQRRFELENFIDIRHLTHTIHQDRKKSNTHLPNIDNISFDSLELEQYDELYNIAGGFIEAVVDSRHLGQHLRNDLRKLEHLIAPTQRKQRELQTAIMQLRMESVETISARLQRSVRHACRATGKEAELHIEGAATLIDSEMLDKLADPLMHILRNAIDHGLETVEQRLSAGKAAIGNIRLRFFQENQNIVAECTDDGCSLDYDAIRTTALNRGVAIEGATNQQLARLILEPGFSTRNAVTQLSGRGVGLDVVNSTVRAMHGTIDIGDATNGGCQIVLRLPLTLMTLHSLIVEVKTQKFAIPLHFIIRAISPGQGQFTTQDSQLIYTIGNNTYPAIALAVRLGLAVQEIEELHSDLAVLLINVNNTGTIAVAVNRFISIHNLVIKSLGKYIPAVRGVAGLATMADGSLLPILHLPDLLNLFTTNSTLVPATNEFNPTTAPLISNKLIMIVDDSLSVRQTLTTFMEDAGYQFITARDGVEAVELLRQHQPNLMLCDIEMPRMNGFELLNHVRTKYGTQLPVIMLTSRSSPKHRHQAIQLGANEYMTKPFNKDELLETILLLLT